MAEEKNSFINTFLATAMVVILVALGAGGLWLYQEKIAKTKEETSTEATDRTQIIANSPIPNQSPTIEDTKSDIEQIREAMADKYHKTLAETEISLSSIDDEFAKGSVHFSGEMGGGWLLAAKTEDGWVIVADGNGTVICGDIEPYDFPVEIVPECWDEATGLMVTR